MRGTLTWNCCCPRRLLRISGNACGLLPMRMRQQNSGTLGRTPALESQMVKPQIIPWSRFIGEFFVIVLGVLAALAVDSWRDRQQEAALGQAYLGGLLRDLSADSALFASTGENLRRKQASLDVLLEVSWGSVDIGPDSAGLLLLPSAVLGWRMPGPQVAAYEELESTGAFRLISDPDLRSQIVLYYEDWERQLERLDRHRSTYPNAIYALAPPAVLKGGDPVGREAADLMSRLRTRAMRDQLNHEANYTWLLAERHAIAQERLATLLQRIRQEIR